jgi:hypothetical protein
MNFSHCEAGSASLTDLSLEVPGDLVAPLARGLVSELAYASGEMAQLAGLHGARLGKGIFAEPLASFQAACRLLDSVGWSECARRAAVEIDMSLAPMMVLRALQGEHKNLIERLREIPESEGLLVRNATQARAEAVKALIETAERQLRRVGINIKPHDGSTEAEWIDPDEREA